MSAATYSVGGRVVFIGAVSGKRGDQVPARRPDPDALMRAGWGYIAVDVPVPGVGVATVQCLAPVEFLRVAIGKNVTATFTLDAEQPPKPPRQQALDFEAKP